SAREHVQHVADRSYLSGPESAEREAFFASRRCVEYGMDFESDLFAGAGRAISPGGAEPRTGELRYSGVHRRRDRAGHDAAAGSGEAMRRKDEVLSGVEFGNVWIGAAATE